MDLITRLGVALHKMLAVTSVDDTARLEVQGLANDMMASESKETSDLLAANARMGAIETKLDDALARIGVLEAANADLNQSLANLDTSLEADTSGGSSTTSTVTGGAGDDSVNAGSGTDSVAAPAADDGSATIDAGAGNNSVAGAAPEPASVEEPAPVAEEPAPEPVAEAPAEKPTVEPLPTVGDGSSTTIVEQPAEPAATVDAGAGNDSIVAADPAATPEGGAGNDSVAAAAPAEAATVDGGAGNDVFA